MQIPNGTAAVSADESIQGESRSLGNREGEYASLGVDQTPIENGRVYKLAYEAA